VEWYLAVLKKYAVFSGRARRKEYWMFFLFNFIVAIGLAIIDGLFGGSGVLGTLYALGVFIPNVAVSVRRLHDTNRSGWWLLLYFIPIIGALVVLFFMVQDSNEDENDFGESPKLAVV